MGDVDVGRRDGGGRPFLRAEWRSLLMLNYEVPATLMAPYVPSGTLLDEYDGRIYISLVAFLFLDTRVLGIPIPFHIDFEEINLRFYVKRIVGDEVRRGVVFIKEIVPKRAIAWVARTFYNENYVAMPTWSDILPPSDDVPVGRFEYRWGRAKEFGVRGEVVGSPALPEAGSHAEFITEHYWGYAKQRDGSTMEYRVEHPQWQVWECRESCFSGDGTQLYGTELGGILASAPTTALLAVGSPITVGMGKRFRA